MSVLTLKRPLDLMLVVGLVAVVAMSVGACGDNDDGGANSSGGGYDASAAAPDRAFRNLATALAAQGLSVDPLPKASLNGAESGVAITGSKKGSARLFATQAQAQDYADEVAKDGDKTTILGSIVFEAASKDDTSFFADAYE